MSEVKEPSSLTCSITHLMYKCPVFVPISGNTYEKDALLKTWQIAKEQGGAIKDPLSNVILPNEEIFINWTKRREVQQFLEEHPEYVPDGWESREDINDRSILLANSGHLNTDENHNLGFMRFSMSNDRKKILLIFIVFFAAAIFMAGNSTIILPFVLSSEQIKGKNKGLQEAFRDISSQLSSKLQDNISLPYGSKIKILQNVLNDEIKIILPTRALDPMQAVFSIIWFAAIGVMTSKLLQQSRNKFIVGAMTMPFWSAGFFICYKLFIGEFQTTELDFGRQYLIILKHLYRARLDLSWSKSVNLEQISKILIKDVFETYDNSRPHLAEPKVAALKQVLEVWEGVIKHQISSSETLSEVELHFLKALMQAVSRMAISK